MIGMIPISIFAQLPHKKATYAKYWIDWKYGNT